jgi:uncharacterized protein YdeI (YjbR/CyaY-like superfamily)
MELTKTYYAPTAADWRNWLAEHYADESEVWLIFLKQGRDSDNLTYQQALDEALCFGWIDSIIQRIDDEKYARKFTPRQMTSNWSETNRRRAAALIRAGRMQPPGLAKVTFALPDASEPRTPRPQFTFTADMEAIFQAHPLAWDYFLKQAPTVRRMNTAWVMSAKKEETRLRRLHELIDVMAQQKPLGMK